MNSTKNLSKVGREDYLENENQRLLNRVAPFLVYFSILMLAGLVGNSIVFAVYHRRFKASVTRTYVLVMSVADLLTNVIGLTVEVIDLRYHATFWNVWQCRLQWFAASTLTTFSGIVLVFVALDRRRVVCRPFHSQQPTIAVKRVRIHLVVGVAIAVILSIPRFVINGQQTLAFPDTNITGVMCRTEDKYVDSVLAHAYDGVLVFMFILMCIMMNVAYGQIACFLWKHSKRRNSSKRSRNAQIVFRRAACENDGNQTEASLEVRPDSEDIVETLESEQTLQCTSHGLPQTEAQHASVAETSVDAELKVHSQDFSLPVTTLTEVVSGTPGAHQSVSRPTDGDTPTKKPVHPGKKIPARTTLMLFVLSVVFVVNFLPFLVMEILDQAEKLEKNTSLVLENSPYINSAVNPLVYSFCSARFRYECRQLLRGWRASVRRWVRPVLAGCCGRCSAAAAE